MKKYLFTVVLGATLSAQAQENKQVTKDTLQTETLDELVIRSVRVKKDAPIAFTNLTKEEFESRNLGQDIPILMNYMPNVVTTSDAGAGVGYTGIRVRGSDATRVNVTINGIPLNDAESQGTFWVNMPDFASSVESMQLQRGLGTSTNGAGAFGASLNLLTNNSLNDAFGEIANSFGSFNTLKHTVQMGTGKLSNNIEISGRLSKLTSDGYIDRATSDLKSYYLQGTYSTDKTMIKALTFGGKERTYQAWNGIDKDQLEKNRRFNPAGLYYDANGNQQFYKDEVDNYQQDHFQLHWNQKYSAYWSSHIGLHYTIGKGYYENYQKKRYSDFGLTPLPLDADGKESKAGIIRRKWLDNDFYGMVFSANYQESNLDVIFGGGINNYEGRHFGTVLWTEKPSDLNYRQRYYEDDANKFDGNIYAKTTYKLNEFWQFFADLQYRVVDFRVEVANAHNRLNFFNPKAGISYFINKQNDLFVSFARGHREPNRNDYEANPEVQPETMNNVELGWRHHTANIQLNANAYLMAYENQLVLTGEIDEVGAFIRSNVGKSYRIGLELDALWSINKHWELRPNIALSDNRNMNYKETNENGEIQQLGSTQIAYSPRIVAGNMLAYKPLSNLQIALLSKYVGKQYLSNNNIDTSKLPSYFVNDLNVSWQIQPQKFCKSININLLVNNIFNTQYVSNGYMWDIDPYYFPQAGINFLAGATLKLRN